MSAACLLFGFVAANGQTAKPVPAGPEPIAAVGHNLLFDDTGKPVRPTIDWVARAQRWYRASLVDQLDPKRRLVLQAYEKRLKAGLSLKGQTALLVEQRLLGWLLASLPENRRKAETLARLQALDWILIWQIPETVRETVRRAERYAIPQEVQRRINDPALLPPVPVPPDFTDKNGAEYLRECEEEGVPIPPPINGTRNGRGWTSHGMVPAAVQFSGVFDAELFSYQDANGVCLLLLRPNDAGGQTIEASGLICYGQSGAACFWDNVARNSQGGITKFMFTRGTVVRIGTPDPSPGSNGTYLGGGAELLNQPGGVCSDCHAGENPFIIHPSAMLSSGTYMSDVPGARANFRAAWARPLVPAGWPRNRVAQPEAGVPRSCRDCHSEAGTGGRLPRLSLGVPSYCLQLRASLLLSMPPGAAPSEYDTPAGRALRIASCRAPRDSRDPGVGG